jgi:very-short-patch-repair endonuclease
MGRPIHTRHAGVQAKELRRTMTLAEARVWRRIKGGATGARFRRQVAIGSWIVDFAALDPKLVLEIDDESHAFRDESDRIDYITRAGFPMLRFWNDDVYRDVVGVVGTITYWVEHLRRTGRPPS